MSATERRHHQPVVFVAGATGCGKSDAAIELARSLSVHHRYHPVVVVNCDALQFYQGLPIATNKVSEEDVTVAMEDMPHSDDSSGKEESGTRSRQCSSWRIPHLFMSFLDRNGRVVCDPWTDVFAADRSLTTRHIDPAGPYNVSMFERDASQFIDDFFARNLGGAVVVCGGTCYYMQSLLVTGSTSIVAGSSCAVSSAISSLDQRAGHSFSSSSTAGTRDGDLRDGDAIDEPQSALPLWERLAAVDPVCASWYHPHDTRRIERCLAIFRDTGGIKPSTMRLEMQGREQLRYGRHRTMVVWIDADSVSWLDGRLNARVDKMVQRGLLAEVQAFAAAAGVDSVGAMSCREDGGRTDEEGDNDDKKYDASDDDGRRLRPGTICEAIGFKELAHCFAAPTSSFHRSQGIPPSGGVAGEAAVMDALEVMKSNTRRYARQQRQWIRNRFVKKYGASLFEYPAMMVRVCVDKLPAAARSASTSGDSSSPSASPLLSLLDRILSAFIAAATMSFSREEDQQANQFDAKSWRTTRAGGDADEALAVELLSVGARGDGCDGPADRVAKPPSTRRCDDCGITVVGGEVQWQAHVGSKQHRGEVKHKALVEAQRLLGRELPPRKRQR